MFKSRRVFTYNELGTEIHHRRFLTEAEMKIRTREEIKALTIFYDFVNMETPPTESQIEEVEKNHYRIDFFSQVTHLTNLFVIDLLYNIKNQGYLSPVTRDVKILAIDTVIDYLTIRKNFLLKGKKGGHL